MLLRKPPSKIEVYNDLDEDVVNFFRVLRSPTRCAALCEALRRTPYSRIEYNRAHRPAAGAVERARRLVIRAHMGFGSNAGTRRSKCGFRAKDWSSRQANNLAWPTLPTAIAAAAARFAGVIVEAVEGGRLIRTQDSPETLHYCDPPYVNSTRTHRAQDHSYRHEMTDADHRVLAETLHAVTGFVVLSGYPSAIYDELYDGWPSITRAAQTQGNARTPWRTEKLWLSPRTAAATADATKDDATIRKCRLFSRRWGYDELTVVNLFALRSTDPRALVEAHISGKDAVGPDNDLHIIHQLVRHDFVVAAWGQWVAQGWLAFRDDQVRDLIRESHRDVHHLGLTLRQQPKHPLYLPLDTVPYRWLVPA